MNVPQAFVQYLEDSGLATFGQDLFIGEAPNSNIVGDAIWWVKASGGTPEARLPTGGTIKNYLIEVFYRNRNYQAVYEAMKTLEEQLNCDGCTPLEGYETMDIQATVFPIDNDLDSEDRKIGLLQTTIRVYQACVN